QGVVEGRPGAVVPPLLEVVVNGPPGREVVGQSPPGTAMSAAVEDGIEDLGEVGFSGPPARLGRWGQGLEDGPFGVGQIAGVWFAAPPLSTFESGLWNRQLQALTKPRWPHRLPRLPRGFVRACYTPRAAGSPPA